MSVKEALLILFFIMLPLIIDANQRGKPEASSAAREDDTAGLAHTLQADIKKIKKLATKALGRKRRAKVLRLLDNVSSEAEGCVGSAAQMDYAPVAESLKEDINEIKELVKPRKFRRRRRNVLQLLDDLSAKADRCIECPPDWVTDDVSCYYIDITPVQKIGDARNKCLAMGADLPIIRAAQENQFIFNLTSNTAGRTQWGVWLGLFGKPDNVFHWVDGTPLAGNYNAWNRGEPNNYRGALENCVQIYATTSNAGKWNDIPCDFPAGIGVLCQRGSQ